MNWNKIRQRIKDEGHHIRVQTELGTAVRISKRQTYGFLDTLEQRGIVPVIEFTEIMPGKMLVVISAGGWERGNSRVTWLNYCQRTNYHFSNCGPSWRSERVT